MRDNCKIRLFDDKVVEGFLIPGAPFCIGRFAFSMKSQFKLGFIDKDLDIKILGCRFFRSPDNNTTLSLQDYMSRVIFTKETNFFDYFNWTSMQHLKK